MQCRICGKKNGRYPEVDWEIVKKEFDEFHENDTDKDRRICKFLKENSNGVLGRCIC